MRTNFDPIVRTRPVKSSDNYYAPAKRADRKRSASAKATTLARKNVRAAKYAATVGEV